MSLGYQLEHLEFAWREYFEFLSGLNGASDNVANECVDSGRVEKRLAAHRRSTRRNHVVVRSRLQDIARGARLQRFEKKLLVVVHRQNEDAKVGPPSSQLLCRLKSRLPRHADIEDCEIDVVLERARDSLLAVGGLSNHVQVWFGG